MTHTHGTVRSDLEKGDKVRINEGGLGNASGIVEEVIPEQKKVKVAVEILNRVNIIEVDVSQVEKL